MNATPSTWADPAGYDVAARRLAAMFDENFAKYAGSVGQAIRDAGPSVRGDR